MPIFISLLIAAIFLAFNPWDMPLAGSKFGGSIMAGAGLLMALANIFVVDKTLSRLQKAESSICTRIIELFGKDYSLALHQFFIWGSSLFSLAFGAYFVFSDRPLPLFALCIWIILMGLGFEGWRRYQKRLTHYLDPYEVQKLYVSAARNAISDHDEEKLCSWFDALAEIGSKACEKSSGALAVSVVNSFPQLIHYFLNSCKTVFFQNKDKELEKLGIQDKVSFTLSFLFQRLELIQDRALQNRLENVITHLITSLGKISLYSAEYDLSLASYPLHYLGRFALQAQKSGMKEVGVKASLTLLEVARLLLAEIDLSYGDLKDPFFSLIKNLEQIEKEAFRLDKSTEIALLKDPFVRLKALFKSDKNAALRDAPLILSEIDRVLGEFEALEVILKTLPPIPELPEEKPQPVTSTPDLDLPSGP